jgi:Arc/MetJ-type ribon-helix-helix transcriptional regulator
MTTVSVPLPDDLLQGIKQLVQLGNASNNADAIRKAIKKYLDDQAVEMVLIAQKEPSLSGDLDELAAQL